MTSRPPSAAKDMMFRLLPSTAFRGGVGKTTLAKKFAELITVAPGRSGHKPNVLLVDLDVDANGLSFRLSQGSPGSYKTVHEVIAERNPASAQAVDVTMAVSLAGGNPQHRGRLYLMPAAPPAAKGIFETCATIDPKELYQLMVNMVSALVMQYEISCVVIDCKSGANPYSAVGAALASVPLLIGRNEPATYDQIRHLPERLREWYPEFQPAKQRVIINAVTVKDLYEKRAQQYGILDYIPLVSDVIHEVEGLSLFGSFRMLLFENYVVDIIKQVLVGETHLIPEPNDVLGEDWIQAITKLNRCEEAPRVQRLRRLVFLRWVGLFILVIGLIILGVEKIYNSLPVTVGKFDIPCIVIGLMVLVAGWYTESERHRIISAAKELVLGGPELVFRMLKEGATHRKRLDDLKKLADSIPNAGRHR